MKPHFLLLVAPLLASGCVPAAMEDEALVQSVRRPDCGLRAALLSRHALPGRTGAPIESGNPVRACGLPTRDEIDRACERLEAVPIPGTQSPSNPDAPDYDFPEFEVANAECAFVDTTETRALCRFDLTRSDAPPSTLRADLTYRFRDLSNDVEHGRYIAHWEVEAECRP